MNEENFTKWGTRFFHVREFFKKCVMSAAEDPEPEGLTIAEENAERLEIQTPESPPDLLPP